MFGDGFVSQVGYVYFPNFLISLLRRQQPQLAEHPLLLYREDRVIALSPELVGRTEPGMTIARAGGRCPEAVKVEVPPGAADEAHNRWLATLAEVATAVEPVGEEEAFFIPAVFHGQSTEQMLKHLLRFDRRSVAGIGSSKMVARLAGHSLLRADKGSQAAKIRKVEAGAEAEFLASFTLQQDTFFPAAVRRGLQVAGIGNFAQLQQLTEIDLLDLLGDAAYRIYLHARGRDYLPIMGLYPTEEIRIGFSCPPEAVIDACRIKQWLDQGVGMLYSRLQEQNQGCRRLTLSLRSGGKMITAEKVLSTGRQERKSLLTLFTLLAEQMNCSGESDQLLMSVAGLYPLYLREQDLFSAQVRNPGAVGISEVKAGLELRYPGVLSSPITLHRRETALVQCDPWRCATVDFLRGKNGVCSPAHP